MTDELQLTLASSIQPRAHLRDWNRWIHQESTGELVWEVSKRYRYHVDLDQCTTREEVLDWICQIAGKTWATDACLAGFVRALIDLVQPRRLEQ